MKIPLSIIRCYHVELESITLWFESSPRHQILYATIVCRVAQTEAMACHKAHRPGGYSVPPFRSNRATDSSSLLRSFVTSRGKMPQAFVAPDADNPHPLGVTPVHDTERRMDEFPQERLIDSGYHPAHIEMVGQGLDHPGTLPPPASSYVGRRPYEVPLFLGLLVIAKRLDHGHTLTPTGDQHGPLHLGRVLH